MNSKEGDSKGCEIDIISSPSLVSQGLLYSTPLYRTMPPLTGVGRSPRMESCNTNPLTVKGIMVRSTPLPFNLGIL